MLKILVVDDQVLFREGLVTLINTQPNMTVVGEAGTVKEAVVRTRELHPDLVLMDYNLPDGNGADATRMILSEQPPTQVIFLTIHAGDMFLLSAIRSGAKGYILKDTPFTTLIRTIQAFEQGVPALSPQMTMRLMNELVHPTDAPASVDSMLLDLTPREIEILRLLAEDATNQEISEKLYLSLPTVKNYLHKIFIKLDFNTRQEAARFARSRGLMKTPVQ